MSNYSDFWLKDYDIDWDFSDDSDMVDVSSSDTQATADLIRLSSARRAISNYVTILTGKSIPVMFNDRNVSCTDGEVVYIGSDVNSKNNFDVAVGLALHEASHIVYSDMQLYKDLYSNVPRSIYNLTEPLNISKEEVAEFCKMTFNYIEDRFIDYCIYKSAPGYRGYYQSLYDKYFNSKVIDDGLNSKLYCTPTTESYSYRIINLTNVNTDLNALPGLYDIAKLLDLSNIVRLDSAKSRYDLAFKIAEIAFSNIKQGSDVKQNGPSNQNNDGDGTPDPNGTPSTDDSNNFSNPVAMGNTSDSSSNSNTYNTDDIFGGNSTSVNSQEDPNKNVGNDPNVSKTKQNKIDKAFSKQKDFLNGKIVKKKVSKKEKNLLDVLEKSQVEILDVAQDYVRNYGGTGAVECIVVKNLTRELIDSSEFPLKKVVYNSYYSKHLKSTNETEAQLDIELQKHINMGIVMGVKLAKRIQFRNEINVDKFSRRTTGKIDKRILHEIGAGVENIFYTTAVHKYKSMNFHISLDASSSMSGQKWNNTIKLCTTIAKAATMLENINVSISIRSTYGKNPYVVMAYDSRKDKFSKIRNLFPYILTSGTTPEGLCYEAIMKHLPKCDVNSENYFINISDGEPCFNIVTSTSNVSYTGASAAQHTRKQVQKIITSGYKVISYFVTEYEGPINSTEYGALFKIMYGKDSNFINFNNLNQIVSTFNKKMVESVDR